MTTAPRMGSTPRRSIPAMATAWSKAAENELGAAVHLPLVPAFVDRARIEVRRLAGSRVAQAAGVEADDRPLTAPARAHGLDERLEIVRDRVDQPHAGHQHLPRPHPGNHRQSSLEPAAAAVRTAWRSAHGAGALMKRPAPGNAGAVFTMLPS